MVNHPNAPGSQAFSNGYPRSQHQLRWHDRGRRWNITSLDRAIGAAGISRATPARSAAGLAEPLWQQDAQLLLIVTDPRHVTVRSQQRGGHVQFRAFVDDVVDPI